MARVFLTPVSIQGYADLNKNELRNFVVQVLAADPASPVVGQGYYNSATKRLRIYNGTGWDEYALTSASVSDATTTSKGIIQLSGDLSGTATSVTVATVGGATAANIADAVTKRHSQGTDAGTTQTSFQLDSGNSGPRLKNSAGEVQVRNAADSGYADLHANNMTVEGNLNVKGTTTTINSTTVATGDSNIELNTAITTAAGNSDGGLTVKRLAADNTTRRDAVLNFNSSQNYWEATDGPTTAAGVTRKLARVYSQAIGDGSATSIAVTHGMNTQFVIVAVQQAASPYAEVDCDIERTDANTVTLKFSAAPTASQYRVTVIG